ncbi:MAG TPA: 30S ribosomal protein S6 [Candidatus Paceibacterota bacterium]
MEESETIAKNYEFAYHISPDLEDADVAAKVQELNQILTQNGGSILSSKEPRKIHLSYPIKTKNYAFFGTMDFSTAPESIERVNSQMKLQPSVLRYILISKPDIQELRILGQYRHRTKPIKTHEPKTQETINKTTPKTKEETEQLEQEIEKVIEGI